ncbi:hypothetical protein [Serratia sp. BIGb0163]|uniref:hypothetical protein n=1 Tax=unclassified Serratia (in: enterobacteria) TaxID=2647522 RepID=UPI002166C56B|nr:hypothetical protein [Serratia sp. BIGb0163]MCS4265393.1 hypothetical protein [Serratia sp. BIGb0163]
MGATWRPSLSPATDLFFIGNVISSSSNLGVLTDFSEKLTSRLFSSGKLVKYCGKSHVLTITLSSQPPALFSQISIILQNPPYAQHSNGLFTPPIDMNHKKPMQQNISLFEFRIAFNQNKNSAK